MSWSLSVVGDAEHIREYVRRASHHWWKAMETEERLLIDHLVGHAVKDLESGVLHALTGRGHSADGHYEAHLTVDKVRATDLPPPIPDETSGTASTADAETPPA